MNIQSLDEMYIDLGKMDLNGVQQLEYKYFISLKKRSLPFLRTMKPEEHEKAKEMRINFNRFLEICLEFDNYEIKTILDDLNEKWKEVEVILNPEKHVGNKKEDFTEKVFYIDLCKGLTFGDELKYFDNKACFSVFNSPLKGIKSSDLKELIQLKYDRYLHSSSNSEEILEEYPLVKIKTELAELWKMIKKNSVVTNSQCLINLAMLEPNSFFPMRFKKENECYILEIISGDCTLKKEKNKCAQSGNTSSFHYQKLMILKRKSDRLMECKDEHISKKDVETMDLKKYDNSFNKIKSYPNGLKLPIMLNHFTKEEIKMNLELFYLLDQYNFFLDFEHIIDNEQSYQFSSRFIEREQYSITVYMTSRVEQFDVDSKKKCINPFEDNARSYKPAGHILLYQSHADTKLKKLLQLKLAAIDSVYCMVLDTDEGKNKKEITKYRVISVKEFLSKEKILEKRLNEALNSIDDKIIEIVKTFKECCDDDVTLLISKSKNNGRISISVEN